MVPRNCRVFGMFGRKALVRRSHRCGVRRYARLTDLNDAPEEGRGTTGAGRAIGRRPGNRLSWETGSVRALSSADRLGFSSEASRLDLYVIHPESGGEVSCPSPTGSCGTTNHRVDGEDSTACGVEDQPRTQSTDTSTCESRARAERARGRGGGSASGASARAWRAGNWEDRRPEAPADGREREAVAEAEAVPSSGWREVTAALGATAGRSHR